jgi:signal peptidase I
MKNFPNEPTPFQAPPPNEKPVCFIYRGPSMRPTFHPGQMLYVRPQALNIAPGDVIVFPDHKRSNFQVVHRVISATADGLITRGDNNMQYDPIPIKPDQVVGRVEMANLGGQIRPVVSGQRGLRRARMLHATLQIERFLRRTLSRPYRWLKYSGIVAKIWHPEISTIRFETQDGPLVKYIHKGKTVASCWVNDNRWRFSRPYDFVICLPSLSQREGPGVSLQSTSNSSPSPFSSRREGE